MTPLCEQVRQENYKVVPHFKTLEEEIGVTLLNRSHYRTQLTAEGKLIHQYCLRLIQTKDEMSFVCKNCKVAGNLD